MTLRLNAYVLAADPAYLAASVASYLEIVDRVVVSFDRRHLGWGGRPVPVDSCLAELATLGADDKLDLRPGDFSHPELPPMVCETRQRQVALDQASESADWVLQLDSDEIAARPSALGAVIGRADASGAVGLDFPSRWLYAATTRGRHLEHSSRWWGPAASYPGPLAVRAGVRLRFARQVDGRLYRCDVRGRNTDPWRAADTPVHEVVPLGAAVLHYSWVRTDEEMAEKARVSGHRDDLDWDRQLAEWRRRRRHPLLTVAGTPLRRRDPHGWLRRTRVPGTARERALPRG